MVGGVGGMGGVGFSISAATSYSTEVVPVCVLLLAHLHVPHFVQGRRG